MIPNFENKTELIDWLIANKSMLVSQKKSAVKHADAVVHNTVFINSKGEADKSIAVIPMETEEIKASLVINTCNVMDSHSDVHIEGLWKKSLSETKDNYLVQEHDFTFAGIISDKVKAYTKSISWADLGAPFQGSTQALVFDASISEDRNEFMFEQYCKGYVKNHSVGMQYVKLLMCVNDKRYTEEKANWDKYFPVVVNGADAEAQGYFWAVTEAKMVEGSAVPRGSNKWTPTQSIEAVTDTSKTIEPEQSTQNKTVIIFHNSI